MGDSSSSESGAEPGNMQLWEEAQKLREKPPRPSEKPTNSFWMRTPSIIDERSLETAILSTKPYEIVIIGTQIVCFREWIFSYSLW